MFTACMPGKHVMLLHKVWLNDEDLMSIPDVGGSQSSTKEGRLQSVALATRRVLEEASIAAQHTTCACRCSGTPAPDPWAHGTAVKEAAARAAVMLL